MRKLAFPKFICAASWLATMALSASAATFPYTENFDDETVGATSASEPAPESGTFTTGGAANAWSVVAGSIAGDLEFQNSFAPTGAAGSAASVNFAGSLGGTLNQAFSMSVEFKLDSVVPNGSNVTVGLGALGADAAFSGGATPYYLADVNVGDATNASNVGNVRILEVGSVNTTIAGTSKSNVAINKTDTYRLTLEGTYEGSSITLRFTIENITTPTPATGVGSFTFSGVDTTPLTGTFFGMRDRLNATTAGGSLDVNFDNFSVAVPEPSAITLLGFGVLGVAARRRRRR